MKSRLKSLTQAGLALCVVVLGTQAAMSAGSRILRGAAWTVAGDSGPSARVMQFMGDGRVMGYGGCNRFSGVYRFEDGILTIGPVMATRRACPEDEMAKETELFKAFDATRKVDGAAHELKLQAEDGSVVLTLTR